MPKRHPKYLDPKTEKLYKKVKYKQLADEYYYDKQQEKELNNHMDSTVPLKGRRNQLMAPQIGFKRKTEDKEEPLGPERIKPLYEQEGPYDEELLEQIIDEYGPSDDESIAVGPPTKSDYVIPDDNQIDLDSGSGSSEESSSEEEVSDSSEYDSEYDSEEESEEDSEEETDDEVEPRGTTDTRVALNDAKINKRSPQGTAQGTSTGTGFNTRDPFNVDAVVLNNIAHLDRFAQHYIWKEYKKGKAVDPIIFEDLEFDDTGCPILDQADLGAIVPDATMLIFGRRRTGKSTFIRDMIYQLAGWYPRALVFSKTDHMNHIYEEHFPKDAIKKDMNNDLLNAVLEFQLSLINHDRKDELKEEDPNYFRCMFIFDDMVDDPNQIRYSIPLNKIFTQGRHFKALGIFATQYFKAFSPSMRTNLDYGVIFATGDEDTRENLKKLFGEGVDKYMFYTMMNKYTRHHMCLIADNSNPAEIRLKKKFKWYKARLPDELGEFYMGNDAFWANEEGGDVDSDFKDAILGHDTRGKTM
jgi:hypothetical protein